MDPSPEILLSSQLLSAYQSSWLWLGFTSVGVLLILFAWGYVILRVVPAVRISEAPVPFACECLLNGFLMFCIAALAGVLVGIRISTTFWLVSACVGTVWVAALRSSPFAWPAGDYLQTKLHLWTVLVILLSSAIWSIDNLRGLVPANDGIIVSPWVDAMLHARQIGDFAQFHGDFRILNGTMYGAAVPPYHYGSYMLPSLIADLGDIPSIQLSTTLFPVLGIFLTGASMLVLANAIGGAGAALAAITLLLMLPDAPFWLRDRDPLNSYAFLEQVGIGGSYAISIMGLALAHAMRSFQTGPLGRSFYSLGLFAGAGVLFKFQILLAYGFLFFFVVLWYAPWRARNARLLSTTSFVAVFIVLVYVLNRIPNAPNLGLSVQGVVGYLDKVLTHLHIGTASNALRVALFPAALVYMLFSVFGVLLPVSLYLCWRYKSNVSMRHLVILCWVFVFAIAVVRLLLEDNKGVGDIAEINRKTLVWPYYVVVLCTAVMGTRYLKEHLRPLTIKRMAIAVPLLLLGPLVTAAHGLQGRWSYSEAFTGVRTPTGLFEMSTYLRKAAAPDEVVQLCENDEYNQLGTFAERPVFISKVVVNAHLASPEERRRFDQLKSVLLQANYKDATALMQEIGIGWLVLSPSCRAEWQSEGTATFAGNGYRLYRSRD